MFLERFSGLSRQGLAKNGEHMSKGLSGIFDALEFLVVLAVEGINGRGNEVVDAGRGPGHLAGFRWKLVKEGFQRLGRWQLLMAGGRVVFH